MVTEGTDIAPSTTGTVGAVQERVKRKAKRIVRQNSRENVASGAIFPQRSWKNSRRPRNGHGRGLPKKGGAGGKGVWGLPGSELLEEYEDVNDPNFDIESLNNRDIELKAIIPEVSVEEFLRKAEPVILEYFEHGDTQEAAQSFEEFIVGPRRYLITQLAIELAMDHKPSHREMTSVLISDLYGVIISEKDIANAFEELLKNLPDLILDTPEAPTLLGNFIARAVADDCLPPKFITTHRESPANEHASTALGRADTLLSMKHGMVRLDNVWGVGGGLRPVKSLTRQMNLLLKEFLSSGDIQEAIRCLQVLEVPHFHHELVYEAVVIAIEAVNSNTEIQICTFLKALDQAVIITPHMMERGFQRVFDDMADICLDVPLAYIMLDRFVERCHNAGFISESVVKKMPNRGRKRFVSEGDGGHIKEHNFVRN
uniref:Programmed cell death protein 4 n=1 Tax=Xenopsylla cheopis TaxID=163159 RepID=A0A6M2DD33_XENCH